MRLEASLRPRTFDEYVGQTAVVEKLKVYVAGGEGARARRSTTASSPGRPGLGKTSLAHIIAAELGVGLHVTSGPALETQGRPRRPAHQPPAARRPLHRRDPPAPRRVEEYLYPAMEDFRLDITIDTGPGRAGDEDRPAALHARRRHHAHRAAHLAAARPLPDPGAARLLRPGGSRADPRALARRHPRGARSTEAGAKEIARRSRGHAAHRQPPAAPGPRLRRGARATGGSTRDVADPRARAAGDRRGAASTRWTGRSSSPSWRSSAAARWAWRPSPPAWASSATRSRTSTSRSCSRRASSSARRGGGWPPPARYRYFGKPPPADVQGSLL